MIITLTFAARYKPEEEQHQLPPLEDVPEDHWTPQAGLIKLFSSVDRCTISLYPSVRRLSRIIYMCIGGVLGLQTLEWR
jgi:hypothetical protein